MTGVALLRPKYFMKGLTCLETTRSIYSYENLKLSKNDQRFL